MQIVENKALVFNTRSPEKYAVIPNHAIVESNGSIHKVAVKWGLDEVRVLRNLGLKTSLLPYALGITGPVCISRLHTKKIPQSS
jgi:hypothetical protein